MLFSIPGFGPCLLNPRLRRADTFSAVVSPTEKGEKSDDRKYVCCSQAKLSEITSKFMEILVLWMFAKFLISVFHKLTADVKI